MVQNILCSQADADTHSPNIEILSPTGSHVTSLHSSQIKPGRFKRARYPIHGDSSHIVQDCVVGSNMWFLHDKKWWGSNPY